jgi:hypothetical protein
MQGVKEPLGQGAVAEGAYGRLVLGGILILATVLRLFALDKGIWQDEYGSLRLIFADDVLAALRAHNHPPFYYLTLKAASLLAREDSFLRLPSVAAGIAAVWCLWLWLRRYSLFGAGLAALLAATHPYFVHYSQEMRSYGLLLLLTTLAFWIADELRHRWTDWWLSAALTLVFVLAIGSHLVAVFVATTVLFYLGWFLLRDWIVSGARRRVPLPLLPPLLAVPLTFLFFTQVFLTAVYDPVSWWMEGPTAALLRAIGAEYLGWQALLWFTGSAGMAVLLVCVLLLLVLLPGSRRADLPLLAAASVLALQLVVVSALIVPVLVARTGLNVLVPVIAYIGIRLGRFRGRPARVLAAVCVGAIAAVYAAWWLKVDGSKPFGPWKEVAELVEPDLRPADLIFVSPFYAQGPLKHYLKRMPPGSIVAFQPDAPPSQVADVRSRLAAPASAGCRRVWQVVRNDQNVTRNREGLDAIEDVLMELVGAPARVERRGLVSVTLYASAGCL